MTSYSFIPWDNSLFNTLIKSVTRCSQTSFVLVRVCWLCTVTEASQHSDPVWSEVWICVRLHLSSFAWYWTKLVLSKEIIIYICMCILYIFNVTLTKKLMGIIFHDCNMVLHFTFICDIYYISPLSLIFMVLRYIVKCGCYLY